MGAYIRGKNWLAVVLVVTCSVVGCGSQTDPNDGVTLKRVVYKKVDGKELLLHVFEPKNRDINTPVAAFVLFHGGGWFMGEPNGLYPHCRYFAELGMVAISAQYRLSKDGNSPPVEAVEDAKSAVRYVRSHAVSLGIDPNKIAAGGASAGGHLAVSTALFDNFNGAGDNQKVSSQPNVLVLISAAFDTTQKGLGTKILEKFKQQLAWVYGPDANEFSPICHIKKISAPCLVLHGTADDIVPFESAQRFYKLMRDVGNNCQLVPLEGAGHQFSVYKENGDNQQFEQAMRKIEEFFNSTGYLKSKCILKPAAF